MMLSGDRVSSYTGHIATSQMTESAGVLSHAPEVYFVTVSLLLLSCFTWRLPVCLLATLRKNDSSDPHENSTRDEFTDNEELIRIGSHPILDKELRFF